MKRFGVKGVLGSLSRLLRELDGYKTAYWVSGLVNSLTDLGFNFVFAYSFMWVLSAVERNDFDGVIKSIGLLAIMFVSLLAVVTVSGYFFRVTTAKAGGALRLKLFSKICRLRVGWFEKRHSGDMVSRLINDIQSAENAWGIELFRPVGAVISGVGSTVLMFTLDWRIGLVAVSIGIVSLIVTRWFLNPLKKRSDRVQKMLGRTTEELTDILGSYKVTRIFNLSGWVLAKYRQVTKDLYDEEIGRTKVHSLQNMVNEFFSNLSFIGLFLIGGIFVIDGSLEFSTLMAVVQLSNGVQNMYWTLSGSLASLSQSLAGSDRVMEVLDEKEEEQEGAESSKTQASSAVSIENVSFGYNEGEKTLKNILLNIKQGETVAIVGGSGSGKSTLFKLLMCFYMAGSGKISIHGRDVCENIDATRSEIAYVPQNNYLFAGTIRENISYGREDASEEDIVNAAKSAYAHDFIMEMEDGYDTMVGERGESLSGGQRQRIAIARALLKNAPILLLDEATSALDSESETKVQKAIDELLKGRTSIIAAHRLSTIRHADRIIVMEDGGIVEEGSHGDLMKLEGRYAYYYNLQFAD